MEVNMSVLSIHHVSLLVQDTHRALQFYQQVLGLALDENRPELDFPGAWLQVGGQQIHLLELPSPDPVQDRPEHGGRDRHVAFQVSDLQAIVQRLQALDIAFTRSRSGREALFCRDYDGNTVELIAAPSSQGR
jgi:glyoxylase I family protein